MNAGLSKSLLAIALVAAAGCATISERDPAVEDARIAVAAARSDPQVARYAPLELEQAFAMMHRVDRMVIDAADAGEVRHAAYLARQRAALAQETARVKAAEASVAAANAERQGIELAARAREAEAAQRTAHEAQLQAEISRRQAEAASEQASAARRQAEIAQRQAASVAEQAQISEGRTRALQEQLAELTVQPTDRGVVVTLSDMFFDTGRTQLQPGGSRAVRKLAAFLKMYPDRTVAIEGFTDSAGSAYDNHGLSERRAQAVQMALIDMGVEPRRIVVRGYGEAFPVASNATAAGRQMNRRVEVVISDRDSFVVPRG